MSDIPPKEAVIWSMDIRLNSLGAIHFVKRKVSIKDLEALSEYGMDLAIAELTEAMSIMEQTSIELQYQLEKLFSRKG